MSLHKPEQAANCVKKKKKFEIQIYFIKLYFQLAAFGGQTQFVAI